eukprot:758791-Hanusia_phi.AAC.1
MRGRGRGKRLTRKQVATSEFEDTNFKLESDDLGICDVSDDAWKKDIGEISLDLSGSQVGGGEGRRKRLTVL